MGKLYRSIEGRLRDFLLAQPMFFVATAPSGPAGHVNVSPKGLGGTFAVLDEHTVAYLDFTGSGVETIAHLRENGRIALMFCAFDGPPKIVRLHGHGEVVTAGDPRFGELLGHFPEQPLLGARAVIVVTVDRISDSCGFGVPLMRYEGERDLLPRHAENLGPERIRRYRVQRNSESIDGLPGLDRAAAETVVGSDVLP
jgi:hypothetical protein